MWQPFKLPLLAVAALVLAPFAPTQGSQASFDQTAKTEILSSMQEKISKYAFVPGVDFRKWSEFLDKHKDEVTKATTPDEFARGVNLALNDFGFSHIALMTPRQVNARVSGSTVGIGVTISLREDGLLVTRTVPGAPAEKAGIEAGDLLMEANGKKISTPLDLQGPEGASVKVKVKKYDGKTLKEYTLVRHKFSTVRPETLSWLDRDTAVLGVYTFDRGYDTDHVEQLMRQAKKAKNLILDLRSNGGGAVMNMQHLLSMFLPGGTPIGTFVSRSMVDRYEAANPGKPLDVLAVAAWSDRKIRTMSGPLPPFTGKVAVLVNGGSGSASEITAAALKENLNAPIVGTKSAGAVLVSLIVPLPQGFNLQYPVNDYVTVKGVRLEKNGVTPDLEAKDVPFVKKNQFDPMFTQAEGLLNRAHVASK